MSNSKFTVRQLTFAAVVAARLLRCVSDARFIRSDGAVPRWPRLAPAFGFAAPFAQRGGSKWKVLRKLSFLSGCGQSPP